MNITQTYQLFLLIITLWVFGGLEMSMAATWVLGDEPITENEVDTTLDLYSEEKPMAPDLPLKRLFESEVTLGKHHIYLPPGTDKIASSEPMADSDPKWDFYLIHIPFTLHPPPGDKHYQDLKFVIRLENDKATAFKLFPTNVVVEEDKEKTIDLSLAFESRGAEGKVGYGYQVTFKDLKPILMAFGEGENLFYWEYTSQQGHYVLPGAKRVLIILEVPHGTKILNGETYYEAVIEEEWLGRLRPKETKTNHYPIYWDLREAESFSNIPWQ